MTITESFFQEVVAETKKNFPAIQIYLVQDDPEDKFLKANGRQNYVDHSYCGGRDHIEIGIYSDVELKLISLFHELGHCILDQFKWDIFGYGNASKMFYEAECWTRGLRYAAEKYPALKFSEFAVTWAFSQVRSYE